MRNRKDQQDGVKCKREVLKVQFLLGEEKWLPLLIKLCRHHGPVQLMARVTDHLVNFEHFLIPRECQSFHVPAQNGSVPSQPQVPEVPSQTVLLFLLKSLILCLPRAKLKVVLVPS